MVVTDSKGNIFDVEAVLQCEHDSEELRMLGSALLEELKLLKGAAVSTPVKKQPIHIDDDTIIDCNGDLEIRFDCEGSRWFSKEELQDILNKMETQKAVE